MSVRPSSDDIRRMIDEALEEIERTELEMLDLLEGVLGPDSAKRVADQITAQSKAPRFKRLLGEDDLPSLKPARGGQVTEGRES